jgi:hypothetical protein
LRDLEHRYSLRAAAFVLVLQAGPGDGSSGEGINAAGWATVLLMIVVGIVAVGLLVVLFAGLRSSTRRRSPR